MGPDPRYIDIKQSEENWAYPGYTRILMSGKSFVADLTGALFWPAEKTLIISDLHLLESRLYGDRVRPLPSYETRGVLARLGEVIKRYQPERIINLGGDLCNRQQIDTLSEQNLDMFIELQESSEWLWITDQDASTVSHLPRKQIYKQLEIGFLKLRHEPLHATVSHEIAGSLQPMAKIIRRGKEIRQRCFISSGTRLILPAFGAANTVGQNVLSKKFDPIFSGESLFIWMIGWQDVTPIAARQLLKDE